MPSAGYRKTTADFGQMANDLQSAAGAFGKMTSAAGAFLGMVNSFAEFENKLIRVNALAGGTAKNLKELSDAARDIAITTKYSAAEAAEAMTLLAQAGFSTKETIEAIPEVLKLAQASMEDINIVSDMVASTLRTFNLDVEETSRVVNVFAAANAKSLASVNKLAFSMRQVGPVASEFGLSLEETTGALSVLYNRGLRGEQAGTALRNIIVRLIKPTKELKETFNALGLAMRDEKGAYNLQQLLSQLRTAGVSDEQLTKMFGREALAGAKTLIAATAGEWDEMTDKITGTNEATRQAAEQLESLKSQLDKAKNAFTELFLSMGETIAPTIKEITKDLSALAKWFRELDSDTKETINTFLKWTSVLLGVKAGVSGIVSVFGKFKLGWVGISTAISKSIKSTTEYSKTLRTLNTSLKAIRDARSEQIRLWEIGSSKGTDWYVRMNEYYKSLHNGNNISLKAANNLKNLTAIEVENLKATKAAASMWKLLAAELKVFAIQAAAVSAILAGFSLVYEGLFGKSGLLTKDRQLSEEEKKAIFPELDVIQEKILRTEKFVTTNMPSLIKRIREAQASLNEVNKIRSESPFGALTAFSEKDAERAVMGLYAFFYKKLDEGVEPTRREIRNTLKMLKLPEELDNYFLESFKKNKNNHWSFLGGYDLTANEIIKEVLGTQNDAFRKSIEEETEASQKIIEESFKKAFGNITQVKATFFKEPYSVTDEEANEALRAWVYGLTGVLIPEEEDAVKYINKNTLFIKDLIKKALSNPEALDRASTYLKNEGLQSFNFEGSATVDVGVNTELTAEQKEKLRKQMRETAAIVAQRAAIDNLKTTYEGLINDFTKQWGILNQEMYAKTELTELDLQQEKLKTDTYNEQVKLLGQIYEYSGLAKDLNTDITKQYLDQNGILSEIGKKQLQEILDKLKSIDEESRGVSEESLALAKGLLEQMTQNGKIAAEKQKQIEAAKTLYNVQNGQLENLQKYKASLGEISKLFDKLATTEPSMDNFMLGMGSGLLGLESDIDSFYEMGKKGMAGFANYMTDSMNNVVDAWGKGWGAMKDALKNTLTDMLKDLAHYFMKQAVYTGITQLFSGVGLGVATERVPAEFLSGGAGGGLLGRYQAKGGAWLNGMQTFANGGIVTGPTLFNHRGGKGLMGEAGPEAIMPLRRDSQGRLGVSVAGGSTLNYAPSFNINMTTGQMDSETSQRNTNRMTKELDNKVKNAVLLVLAKEKRPGGLLYGR